MSNFGIAIGALSIIKSLGKAFNSFLRNNFAYLVSL